MKIKDVFLVCPTHGDIFVHRNADLGTATPSSKDLFPCRDDVQPPTPFDSFCCPLCNASFNVVFRDPE